MEPFQTRSPSINPSSIIFGSDSRIGVHATLRLFQEHSSIPALTTRSWCTCVSEVKKQREPSKCETEELSLQAPSHRWWISSREFKLPVFCRWFYHPLDLGLPKATASDKLCWIWRHMLYMTPGPNQEDQYITKKSKAEGPCTHLRCWVYTWRGL